MAFLQTEIPPSTAPVHVRRPSPDRAPPRAATPVALPRPAKSGAWWKVATGLLAAALFALPGYLAARATESLAIGILTADFAFLLTVALWSSMAGGGRR